MKSILKNFLLLTVVVVVTFLSRSNALAPCDQSTSGNCREAIDMILVLDRSFSISPSNWYRLLDGVTNLISKFATGINDAHWGIIPFESRAAVQLELSISQSLTQNDVINQLDLVLKNGTNNPNEFGPPIEGIEGWGYTNPESALMQIRSMLQSGSRLDINQTVIFITDGNPTLSPTGGTPTEAELKQNTIAAATILKADFPTMKLVTIGIGIDGAVDFDFLAKVASAPSMAYNLTTFDQQGISLIKQDLVYKVCNAVCPTNSPTKSPTKSPITNSPITKSPVTKSPTRSPRTKSPTISPTLLPTFADGQTASPVTKSPTKSPITKTPTKSPVTKSPVTKSPTKSPITKSPTMSPIPTSSPTTPRPTRQPIAEANGPTFGENLATKSPTVLPTTSPTTSPTEAPTTSPTIPSPTLSPVTSSPTKGTCNQISRDVIFLIDTSASMSQTRINNEMKTYLFSVYDMFINTSQSRIGVAVFGLESIGEIIALNYHTKSEWDARVTQAYDSLRLVTLGNTPMAEGIRSAREMLNQNKVVGRPQNIIIISDGLPEPLSGLNGAKPSNPNNVMIYDVATKPRFSNSYLFCGSKNPALRRSNCENITPAEYIFSKVRAEFLGARAAGISIGFLGIPRAGIPNSAPDLNFFAGKQNSIRTFACLKYQNINPNTFCLGISEGILANVYDSGVKTSTVIGGCMCQTADNISLVDNVASTISGNADDWYDLTYPLICTT